MTQPNQKITALYCRLSSEDDSHGGDSNSIHHQKEFLKKYANDNDFENQKFFVDDSYSGVSFQRPAFQEMLRDAENGNVAVIITKDLSRLGRNYILTGQYTEMYFPSKNVRYIALNDGVDSQKGENEIAAFKNILNEMVARDTSRKIKSAFRARHLNGEYISCSLPLGYKRDNGKKGTIIPDEETRWVIGKIFNLAAHGLGYYRIANRLREEKIPTPSVWAYQKYGHYAGRFENKPEEQRYNWTVTTVTQVLQNETYRGHLVHYKQGAVSFKNRKHQRKPQDEWLRVENTHLPIIPQELWDAAHTHINSRKRTMKTGTVSIFGGLVKCGKCGWGLSAANKNDRCYYRCAQYANVGCHACSSHYIGYNLLYGAVLGRLQYWLEEVHGNAPEILNRLLHSGNRQRELKMKYMEKELQKAQRRLKEVDNLFAKMYEDLVAERLDEDNYTMLSAKYRGEQQQLKEKTASLSEKLVKANETRQGAEQWLALIEKYEAIDELTAPLLNELIDKIVIHQAYKDENGNTMRNIDIHYRFVGKID
jgi:DNA invertase Pin-like site-specific DNA recombinase